MCGEETKSKMKASVWTLVVVVVVVGWGSGRSVRTFHDTSVVGVVVGWDKGGGTCIHVVGPRTGLGGAGGRRASRVENIICGALQLAVI